jgi:mono/diheme cytochrome c family protein
MMPSVGLSNRRRFKQGMTVKSWHAILVVACAGAAAGCSRQPERVDYVASEQVGKLRPELRSRIDAVLTERCGTPRSPKLLGRPDVSRAHLRQGTAVYARYCAQCHGMTGDGRGEAAVYLNPRPRDYRRGIFKFTSTTYGSKPLREDLLRTIRRGIRGTSMPSFSLLDPKDLHAVVDYVLVLTHRGELEAELAGEAEVADEVDPARVGEMVATILGRWEQARGRVVYPTAPMPQFTPEIVDQGKKAFLTVGCAQCHGEDGRGQLATNLEIDDAWGNKTKAADLTSGMLRGGTEPLDIFRHVDAGINGTPMPAFHDRFQKEPERIWHLVGYVLSVAETRRLGKVPGSGLLQDGILKPLPGVAPTAAIKAAARQAAAIRSGPS